MSLILKIKKLDKELPTPVYAYPGDAAFDLYSRETIKMAPGEKYAVPTGIAIEISDGYVGLIWDKSGLAIKAGLKTLGGVVDSNYRGEILVGLINLSKTEYLLEKGHKVAQMIIQKKEDVVIEEVEELSSSERGEKGFGSSGK